VFAFFAVVSGSAYPRQPPHKVSPELQSPSSDSSIDVIVQFNQVPTDKHYDKVRARGGNLKGALGLIKGALFSLPPGAVKDLADDPDVAYISPDRSLRGKLDLTADAVNASAAWVAKLDGTGIGVAIIDSGISNLQDLKSDGSSRVVFSLDLVGGGTKDRYGHGLDLVGGRTNDRYGHGEHVAGIVAGNGYSSTCATCTRTFKGMAPNANLINLRVLDQNGNGVDSAVIAAIDQAIALKSIYNIRVINL
jgi:serine protease AprX